MLKIHLVYQQISEELAKIDILRYVKIYNGSIKASNFLSENGKKEPIIKIGDENIVGVELLVDIPNKTIQFYSITSSVRGYGEKIVSSVVNSAPKDWEIVVVMEHVQVQPVSQVVVNHQNAVKRRNRN